MMSTDIAPCRVALRTQALAPTLRPGGDPVSVVEKRGGNNGLVAGAGNVWRKQSIGGKDRDV